MASLAQTTVLVPVYRPGPHLTELVMDLLPDMPAASRIVIVDDGSGSSGRAVLDAIGALGCTVLRHRANRGKGAALKTGIAHIRAAFPGFDVVYADADGQHHAADIRRVADRIAPGLLVLGVRDFDRMPPRSRFGNTVTRWLFHKATGHDVLDTQTGLRGLPVDMLDRLCEIPGTSFEYEMNVLLDAATTGRPIATTTITTRYLDGNAASHFSGVTDSIRIYRPLIRQVVAARNHRNGQRHDHPGSQTPTPAPDDTSAVPGTDATGPTASATC